MDAQGMACIASGVQFGRCVRPVEWESKSLKLLDAGRENDDTLYQLQIRRKELLNLCQQWKTAAQVIPSNEPLETWGPSLEELLAATDFESVAGNACYVDAECDMISDKEVVEPDIDDASAASGEDDLLESIAFMDIYNYV
jgi:hypothetical protein